jgi:hypothetical protein
MTGLARGGTMQADSRGDGSNREQESRICIPEIGAWRQRGFLIARISTTFRDVTFRPSLS